MRTSAVLAACTLCGPASLAQIPHTLNGEVDLGWQTLGPGLGPVDEWAEDVVVAGGRALSVRSLWGESGAVAVSAHDVASGALLWESEWSGGSGEQALAHDLSADGDWVAVTLERVQANNPVVELGLLVFDAHSGSLQWETTFGDSSAYFTFPPPVQSSVEVANGRVHVAGPTLTPPPAGPLLRTFDAASGALLWDAGPSITLTNEQSLALLVDAVADRVYVAGSGLFLGDTQAFVRAVDASTGAQLWQKLSGTEAAEAVTRLALAGDGSRLFAGIDSTQADSLEARDPANGFLLWSTPIDSEVRQLEASADGLRVGVSLANGLSGLRCYHGGFGGLLWVASAEGAKPGLDEVVDLAIDPLNNAFVYTSKESLLLGGIFDADGWSTASLDLDSGAPRWSAFFQDPSMQEDRATALALDLSSRTPTAIVLGETRDSGSDTDARLEAYELSAGGLVWASELESVGANFNGAHEGAFSADGSRLYVIEGTPDVGAYDPHTGQVLWTAQIDDPDSQTFFGVLAGERANGSELVLAGLDAGNFGARSIALAVVDTNDGATLSYTEVLQPQGPALGVADAALSPDGSRAYVLVQRGEASAGLFEEEFNALVFAFDVVQGTLLWERDLSPQPDSFVSATSLAVDPAGERVYALSGHNGSAVRGLQTDALDASTGAVLWSQVFQGASLLGVGQSFEQAGSLLLSPAGDSVFVCGETFDGDAIAHPSLPPPAGLGVILSYAASSGAPQWEFSWSGSDPGRNAFRELAIDAAGSTLYAAGGAGFDDYGEQSRSLALALDVATQAVQWVHLSPATTSETYRFLSLSPGAEKLYVGGPHGNLFPLANPFDPSYEHLNLRCLEASSGATVWEARTEGEEFLSDLVADELGVIALGWFVVEGVTDALIAQYRTHTLRAQPDSVSVLQGGAQVLELDAPSSFAGDLHVLLGSLSGSAPGLSLGSGIELPLVFDDYTLLTLLAPNQAPLLGGVGALDGLGDAVAGFVLPAGAPPTLAGLSVHHAYVVASASGLEFASNAVALELTP